MFKKFNMNDCKLANTPTQIGYKLVKDDDSLSINQTSYFKNLIQGKYAPGKETSLMSLL